MFFTDWAFCFAEFALLLRKKTGYSHAHWGLRAWVWE